MSEKERILLVEDDEAMRHSCRKALEMGGYEVLEAASPPEAEPLLLREEIDLVVTDLRMPAGGGQQVLRAAKALALDLPILVITAYPTVQSAIEAFKEGVVDYLLKPFTGEQLLESVGRALGERRGRERARMLRQMPGPDTAGVEMIGCSPRFHALMADVRRAAALEAAVLITGETGSGKELVARAVHRYSRRAAGPFVVLNCAALPQALLEGELFGFERGAFTGAVAAKPGLIEAADRGILFLDEVGDMSLEVQAKLLRSIEEKSCRRVGALGARPVDIRLLSATHRDLREEVRRQRFREDLYYRLAVLEVCVPPLRERPEDIPRLAVWFLDRLNAQNGPRPVDGFTDEALERLVGQPWPGNVRELQNALQRAYARATGPLITTEDLGENGAFQAANGAGAGAATARQAALSEFERNHISQALARHGGNVTQTAQTLGVHRTTLQRLMRKHRLDRC